MKSQLFPTLIVSLVTLFWLMQALIFSNPYKFIQIGQRFIQASHTSPLIDSKLDYSASNLGYDGQFYYFIALDPTQAFNYIDNPTYRYSRIVFPMLSRLLSLGNLDLIPSLMLIINTASIIGGVYFLSLFLKKNNLSPYFSLIYGFYPGLYLALNYDLAEPLAYLLTLAGVYFFSIKNSNRLLISALLFSLSILTRETVAVFPLVFGAEFILKISKKKFRLSKNWLNGCVFYAIVFLPYLILKFGLLNFHWMVMPGASSNNIPLELIPLAGIFKLWPWNPNQLFQIFNVVVPSLLLGILTIRFIKRKITSEMTILLLNILLSVLLLVPGSFLDYNASGRINIAVVVSSLLCLPHFIKANKRFLYIYLMIVMFWFLGWQSVPFLAEYGFGALAFLIAGAIWVKVVWKDNLI